MHVTIEETDEGVVICLFLQPSEISSELRDFASLRPGRRALPQSLISTLPPTVLRSEAPSPPPSLDVGVGRTRSRPAREDVIAVLDQAIRAKREVLGGAVGVLSRGFGNLLSGTGIDPRAGVSVSQQLAELTGSSIAEVHLGFAAPFFAEVKSGGAFGRALVNDFRGLARAGDAATLAKIEERLGVTERILETTIKSRSLPQAVIGEKFEQPSARLGRGLLIVRTTRALKNVRELKRQAELNRKLAEVVQGEP